MPMTTRSQTNHALTLRRTPRVKNFFGHIQPTSSEAAPQVDWSVLLNTNNITGTLPPPNPQLSVFIESQNRIHSDPDSDYSPTSNRSYDDFQQLSIYDRWRMDLD